MNQPRDPEREPMPRHIANTLPTRDRSVRPPTHLGEERVHEERGDERDAVEEQVREQVLEARHRPERVPPLRAAARRGPLRRTQKQESDAQGASAWSASWPGRLQQTRCDASRERENVRSPGGRTALNTRARLCTLAHGSEHSRTAQPHPPHLHDPLLCGRTTDEKLRP